MFKEIKIDPQIITLIIKFQNAVKSINRHWNEKGRPPQTELDRFQKEISDPLDQLWEKQSKKAKERFLSDPII